jgi:hypothetical protein
MSDGKAVVDEGAKILKEQGPDAFQDWLKALGKEQRQSVADYMGIAAEILVGFMRKWQYMRADIVLYLLNTTIQCPSCQYPNFVEGLYHDHTCHLCGERFENIVNLGPNQEHTG